VGSYPLVSGLVLGCGCIRLIDVMIKPPFFFSFSFFFPDKRTKNLGVQAEQKGVSHTPRFSFTTLLRWWDALGGVATLPRGPPHLPLPLSTAAQTGRGLPGGVPGGPHFAPGPAGAGTQGSGSSLALSTAPGRAERLVEVAAGNQLPSPTGLTFGSERRPTPSRAFRLVPSS
jgi:hypothetical protein